jgi:OOP family OmpA-OmpF porin
MKNTSLPNKLVLGTALTLFAGAASAEVVGYLSTSRDTIVKSGTGLCWRTTAWTPERAAEPCDPVPKVQAPAPMPVAAAPEPKPEPKLEPKAAPAPVAAVAEPKRAPLPRAPVIQRLTLSTELLFDFDNAKLRPGGEQKLRELAKSLEGADLQSLAAVGHADRIGTEQYNRGLSEQRAQAVKSYLSELGIETKRIDVAGRGETEPITDGACRNLRGLRLISCLQPNRRVEVEVRGHRQASK